MIRRFWGSVWSLLGHSCGTLPRNYLGELFRGTFFGNYLGFLFSGIPLGDLCRTNYRGSIGDYLFWLISLQHVCWRVLSWSLGQLSCSTSKFLLHRRLPWELSRVQIYWKLSLEPVLGISLEEVSWNTFVGNRLRKLSEKQCSDLDGTLLNIMLDSLPGVIFQGTLLNMILGNYLGTVNGETPLETTIIDLSWNHCLGNSSGQSS